MRTEALDFRARGQVNQRDTVGDAVGDVKRFARAIRAQPHWPPSCVQSALHLERSHIDFADRVAPCVRDVEGLAVRREGNASGPVANRGARHHLFRLRVDGQDGVIALASHKELISIRGELDLGRGEVRRLSRSLGLRARRRGEGAGNSCHEECARHKRRCHQPLASV